MGSRVVQVKCPKCSQPIKSSEGTDMVFWCAECGAAHTRGTDGAIENIEIQISAFDPAKEQAVAQTPHERVYMPVWQIVANVSILSQQVAGGVVSWLANKLSGGGNSGTVLIYIPAIDLEPEPFKAFANMLSTNPPAFRQIPKFEENSKRLPCVIDRVEADQLADFIVLSNEAEKPGVLQQINYNMSVQGRRLIYLAYHRSPAGFVLAV